jgi:hypothetical protein
MRLRPVHILVVALNALSGCVASPDLKGITRQPLRVSTFTERIETGERQIAVGSPEATRLISWLEDHSDGWKHSYISYAPGLMVVSGTNFTLNIHNAGVILNIVGQRQYERDASASDFTFLLQ